MLPYAEALDLQSACVDERRGGSAPDRLLLLEHPPVITRGRNAKPENLRSSPEELAASGIGLFEVARGGDVTYHAPGQLVGYLIADLRAGREPDVHAFLRGIETALIDALSELRVPARRIAGMTGVYVSDSGGPARKIASIGVGVRHWVSFHGFALNVDLDLAGFERIVPCGLHEVVMTSVAVELGSRVPEGLTQRTRNTVARAFERHWPW